MLALDVLVDRVKSYHPAADADLISRAYQFASWAHRTQRRKSGEPYFVHPASVAGILADLRLDAISVSAGLLHDVVEDTTVTLLDLQREFGTEVAGLVDGVTKLGKVSFVSKEDRQAESFRKMLVAMAEDLRVLLVKLCDRLDNMRTLDHMAAESQERVARETMDIYAPLANRLGLHTIKGELEDLSLRYIEPEAYQRLVSQLDGTQPERQRYIEAVCRLLHEQLSKLEFAAEVHGRSKHVTSIHRKMREQNCEFHQLYDLLGFRVVVESSSDCYAALGVVHSLWTPVPNRFKDYIALPKSNLYQSLHTTVLGPEGKHLEVQIRTQEMHRIAERGVAAHWYYKEKGASLRKQDIERFTWLRDLSAAQTDLRDPAEFLNSVKLDLFGEEVFVFTPKGDLKVLPLGASAVDLAYAVHSDLGNACGGARVNGHIVPLRYKLRSGDVVEIIRSSSKVPNKDWLDLCVTARARSRIRSHLRAETREKSQKFGKELLERQMHLAGLSLAKLLKNEQELHRVLEALRVGTVEEMFLKVGYGKAHTEDVVGLLRHEHSEHPPSERGRAQLAEGPLERLVSRVRGRDQAIKVSGVDDVLVRYGRCCNPLPGDPIVGFITRGRGVTVHRRECEKVLDTDPERRIDVSWATGAKVGRPVQLRVITQNLPGILADVSHAFSAQKVNINEANCRAGEDGRACNLFTFTCQDTGQLRAVIRALAKLKGVVEVARV